MREDGGYDASGGKGYNDISHSSASSGISSTVGTNGQGGGIAGGRGEKRTRFRVTLARSRIDTLQHHIVIVL